MGLIQIPEFRMSNGEHIVALTYDHLTRIQYNEDTKEYMKHIPNYVHYIWDNAVVGSSWTAICKGKVIAVFGIRYIWNGLAEMWMVPSKDIHKYAISLVRGARALTDTAIHDNEIKRLQIVVKVENDVALRFAKSLGFGVESVMTKFGPEGADYYMMVRF